MLLVYGHDTRGRVAPEGGVSINRNIPIRHVLMCYSQLLGGSASFPGNAAAKRAFSRARSVYCSVHFRAS